MDMLLLNNCVALIKNDVGYIVPKISYDRRGVELGERWIEE